MRDIFKENLSDFEESIDNQDDEYTFIDTPIVTESDFLKHTEGKGPNGISNANVTIAILTPDENGEIDEEDKRFIENGVVHYAIIPNGLSMIDVIFDSNVDFDYIQAGTICERFFDLAGITSRENTNKIPTLSLSITPKGDVANIMTAVDCVWSYVTASPELVCTGIRFICKTENISFVQLTPEQVNTIFDEIDAEDIKNGYL